MHALQHRGQEGCGIITSDEKNFYAERRLGLVGDNFTKGESSRRICLVIVQLDTIVIQQAGNNLIKNVQPFFADLTFRRYWHCSQW